ncbi:hypothetical protein AB0B07_29500 [Streptomyces sioyaensis]|uniref:hypothetical protein n=1 Tax=Streptomyces sioyaensis TaxID=67364 RepID=UPI0033D06FCF
MDHRQLEQAMSRPGAAAEIFETAASVLEEIAAGRRGLRAVRHPLGFTCFPVERVGDRGVCVHAFGGEADEEAAQPTTSPVHSHSWELTSCVLYGAVGNLRVRVVERPTEPTHRVFEVLSHPSGVDEIQPTSRLVSCGPGTEQTSLRGTVYTLPAGEFHTTVVPEGGVAATLVLGRSLPGRFDLSLGPLHGTGHQVVRQACNAEATARTARTVLRRIHDPRP